MMCETTKHDDGCNCLDAPERVVEEWRVYSPNPGNGYPPYDFTWSSQRNPHLGDAKERATAFVEMIMRDGRSWPWPVPPKIYHRTITLGTWSEA